MPKMMSSAILTYSAGDKRSIEYYLFRAFPHPDFPTEILAGVWRCGGTLLYSKRSKTRWIGDYYCQIAVPGGTLCPH
jgi:hypothetical protein